jgi:hypothetical protein
MRKKRSTIKTQTFSLLLPKNSDDTFIWADYFEMFCMLKQSELNDEDFYQYIKRSSDFQVNDDSYNESNQGMHADKEKMLVDDGVKNIILRSSMLKDKYPFIYSREDNSLRLKEKLTKSNYTYLVLLFASNLKYVDEKSRLTLSSSFEKISLDVMKSIYPTACVKLFGSSNGESHVQDEECYSEHKLKDRIKVLAKEIRERPEEEVGGIKDSNGGDGGLDIVGYTLFNDTRSSIPLLLAQCACSKEDWMTKQFSASRATWEKWIHINDTSLQQFMFVPFPYIKNDGDWVSPTSITHNVMVDRIRIMSVLGKKCSTLDSFDFIKCNLGILNE